MKHTIPCILIILSSIFLFSELSHARKDQGGYWKDMMNDQPMPKAIKDLFFHQEEESVPSLSATTSNKDGHRFVRDFDPRTNAIIYHSSHPHHAHHQPEEMKHEMESRAYIQTLNHG